MIVPNRMRLLAGLLIASTSMGGTARATETTILLAQTGAVQSAPLPPLASPPGSSTVAPRPTVTTPDTPAAPNAAAPNAAQDAAMEERIRALQTELKITSDQQPAWTKFAQTMRDNARSTDNLFRQRAGAAASMTALQNMQSYAVTARQYADNTQSLATAFEALYNGLSPEQKQLADSLFRQQATQNAARRTTK